MKKILFVALIVLVSATTFAGKKNKKNAEQKNLPAPVVLASQSDTLSYAAGYQQVMGLVDFLLSQKMDTAYMADFIIGMREAIDNGESPSFKARSLGYNIAAQLKSSMVPALANELKGSPDTLNAEKFYAGFFACLEKDTTHYKTIESAAEFFQKRLAENREQKAMAAKKAGQDFLAENATKEGVKTTESGLQYKVIVAGNGEVPKSNQQVRVKYEGKLIDGTVFDSSYKRSDPVTKFRCDQVIKGWTEALTMMPVGSTWELFIPYDLGYGDRGAGQDIPPYATLIFKVELLGIE